MFRNTNKFCRNKFLELGCVVGECNIGNDIPMEFENDMTVNENAVTYKEKSPFGKHYDQMYLKCIDTFHKIWTMVVEIMYRKLKDSCNKFILNKYPQTVVNCRK